MDTKVEYTLLITGAIIVIATGILLLCNSFDYDNIYKNVNVWYKVSTDPLYPNEVVALDMTKGYSMCDEEYIYIIVYSVDSEEEIIIALPNKGYWSAPKVDTTSIEIQKHFGKLEQDLKKSRQ